MEHNGCKCNQKYATENESGPPPAFGGAPPLRSRNGRDIKFFKLFVPLILFHMAKGTVICGVCTILHLYTVILPTMRYPRIAQHSDIQSSSLAVVVVHWALCNWYPSEISPCFGPSAITWIMCVLDNNLMLEAAFKVFVEIPEKWHNAYHQITKLKAGSWSLGQQNLQLKLYDFNLYVDGEGNPSKAKGVIYISWIILWQIWLCSGEEGLQKWRCHK